MTDSIVDNPTPPAEADVRPPEMLELGAAELARRIADGALSSEQVVRTCIERIQVINPRWKAMVASRFEAAIEEAKEADQQRDDGRCLPPLHGVPVTVKDCFDIRGMASTLGLASRTSHVAGSDAEAVRRLRAAGAIVLGKSNVPQAMIFHECDNPLFGRTPHPEFDDRTCGGSSGGEAVLVALHASPLGLGTDLGGSIRVPAHFCGVHGFKPTSTVTPDRGIFRNLRGMEAIPLVPGTFSRHMEDVVLAHRILSQPAEATTPLTAWQSDEAWMADEALVADDARVVADCSCPNSIGVRESEVKHRRIGVWEDDGYFSPSPSIRRAVREAADRLSQQGAEVVEFQPPRVRDMMLNYVGILSADGGADLRNLLRGNDYDPRIKRLNSIAQIPAWLRFPLAQMLMARGRFLDADFLLATPARSAHGYWKLCAEATRYRTEVERAWKAAGLHAALCPAFGLPAFRHGESVELLAAASYAFLANLLDWPAGVVATTRVREDEQSDRDAKRDRVLKMAAASEQGSAGLPVGVQVMAASGRDRLVLTIMTALAKEGP